MTIRMTIRMMMVMARMIRHRRCCGSLLFLFITYVTDDWVLNMRRLR